MLSFPLTWSWCSRRREHRTPWVRWVCTCLRLAGWHRVLAECAPVRHCRRRAWYRAFSASCRRCAVLQPGSWERDRRPEAGRSVPDRRPWTPPPGLRGTRSACTRYRPGWKRTQDVGSSKRACPLTVTRGATLRRGWSSADFWPGFLGKGELEATSNGARDGMPFPARIASDPEGSPWFLNRSTEFQG